MSPYTQVSSPYAHSTPIPLALPAAYLALEVLDFGGYPLARRRRGGLMIDDLGCGFQIADFTAEDVAVYLLKRRYRRVESVAIYARYNSKDSLFSWSRRFKGL
jgi:hypothetical protein